MEEPELTLVSTSDVSIAETEFANLTLEERENEAKNTFQVNVIAPFNMNTHDLYSSTQLRVRNYLHKEIRPKGLLQVCFVLNSPEEKNENVF